jgi:hypothetical protein
MTRLLFVFFMVKACYGFTQISITGSFPTRIPTKNEYAKLNYDSTSMVLTGFRADVGWRKIAGPVQRVYVVQSTGQTVTFPISVIPFMDAEITVNGVELRKDTHYTVINNNTITIIDPPIRNSLICAKF